MIRCLVFLLILTAMIAPAVAADLTVLSAGAIAGVARTVQPTFQSSTVTLRNDTVGGLLKRIASGETFDVVLMSSAGLAELVKAGRIVPSSVTVLARVGVGVGVRSGVPAPDISTVAAFRAAMLNARAIAYVDPASGGSSGIYLAKLFGSMGIAEAMAPKSVLVNGGLAAEALLDGRADLALQQVSEIIAVPGVTLVGALPAEIQSETTYAGAIATTSNEPEAARAFVAAMASPTVQPILAAKGMTPP
jgi:molybdate transport system substrate-binding protein